MSSLIPLALNYFRGLRKWYNWVYVKQDRSVVGPQNWAASQDFLTFPPTALLACLTFLAWLPRASVCWPCGQL